MAWSLNTSEIALRQDRFEGKLELQPNNCKTLSLYSDFLYEQGLYDKAVRLYARSIKAGNENGRLRLRLTRARLHIYRKYILREFPETNDSIRFNNPFKQLSLLNCFASSVDTELSKRSARRASFDLAYFLTQEIPIQRRPVTLLEAATIEFRNNNPKRALSILDAFDFLFLNPLSRAKNMSEGAEKESGANIRLRNKIRADEIVSSRSELAKYASLWLRAILYMRVGFHEDALTSYSQLCEHKNEYYESTTMNSRVGQSLFVPFPIATIPQHLKASEDPSSFLPEDWFDKVGVLLEEEEARPLIGLPLPWVMFMEKGRCYERFSHQAEASKKSLEFFHLAGEQVKHASSHSSETIHASFSRIHEQIDAANQNTIPFSSQGLINYDNDAEDIRYNNNNTNSCSNWKGGNYQLNSSFSSGVSYRISELSSSEALEEEQSYFKDLAQREYTKAFKVLLRDVTQDESGITQDIENVEKYGERAVRQHWLGQYHGLDHDDVILFNKRVSASSSLSKESKEEKELRLSEERTLKRNRNQAIRGLSIQWAADATTWLFMARGCAAPKMWPSMYDFASACVARLPSQQDLMQAYNAVIVSTKPFHFPEISRIAVLRAEALLIQAIALLGLDEVPAAIEHASLSYELNESCQETQQFLVTQIAIPLHQLLHGSCQTEDICSNTRTTTGDAVAEKDDNDEANKEVIGVGSNFGSFDYKQETNKYGLSAFQLKKLEAKVITLREQVRVRRCSTGAFSRALFTVDRLVKKAMWRREVRMKLFLMRSARKVQRAWRKKMKWDQDAGWRILFADTSTISNTTDTADPVSQLSPIPEPPPTTTQGAVPPLLLSEDETSSPALGAAQSKDSLIPKEWDAMVDSSVRANLQDSIRAQLVQWQSCALRVQTRARSMLARLLKKRRNASLIRLGGYFLGLLTRVRIRRVATLHVLLAPSLSSSSSSLDYQQPINRPDINLESKPSNSVLEYSSSSLSTSVSIRSNNQMNEMRSQQHDNMKKEYDSLLQWLSIAPDTFFAKCQGFWCRCGLRIGTERTNQDDGFLPFRDLVFDWSTYIARDEQKNGDENQEQPCEKDIGLTEINDNEWNSLSVIGCNKLVASRFGSDTLINSLSNFKSSVNLSALNIEYDIIERSKSFQSEKNRLQTKHDCTNDDQDETVKEVAKVSQVEDIPDKMFKERDHALFILRSSSYWLPSFSVPLHAVLYPWAQTRNLIVASPSFTSSSVRALEVAVRLCTTELVKRQAENSDDEPTSSHEKIVGVHSVLGRLESLHICSPMLSVHGLIRLLQLLVYPLTPKEISSYELLNGASSVLLLEKSSTCLNNSIISNSDNSISESKKKNELAVVNHTKSFSTIPKPSLLSQLQFKNATRASTLHTLTISGMPIHGNALKCIGRALLLPKSSLRHLHLDDLTAYSDTILPTCLKASNSPNSPRQNDDQSVEEASSTYSDFKTGQSSDDGSSQDNTRFLYGEASSKYKSVRLKPSLSPKFKKSRIGYRNQNLEGGKQAWHPPQSDLSEIIASLLPFVQRAHSLVTLSIRRPSPPLFEDGSDLLNDFATSLYTNSSIQRLNLEGNCIGFNGLTALLRSSNSRRKRCALQELNLNSQHPILPISAIQELVDRSEGSSYVVQDSQSGQRTLHIPFKHNQPVKLSLLERQVRSPGALPFLDLSTIEAQPSTASLDIVPGALSPSRSSSSSSSCSSSVVSKLRSQSVRSMRASTSFSSSYSSSSTSRLRPSVSLPSARFNKLKTVPDHQISSQQQVESISHVKSGAQRGRLNLPHEVDARTLDFNNDVAYAIAATDTIRNNSTRVLF